MPAPAGAKPEQGSCSSAFRPDRRTGRARARNHARIDVRPNRERSDRTAGFPRQESTLWLRSSSDPTWSDFARVLVPIGHMEQKSSTADRPRENEKAYGTWYSQAVTHPSTNQARRCLTSVI